MWGRRSCAHSFQALVSLAGVAVFGGPSCFGEVWIVGSQIGVSRPFSARMFAADELSRGELIAEAIDALRQRYRRVSDRSLLSLYRNFDDLEAFNELMRRHYVALQQRVRDEYLLSADDAREVAYQAFELLASQHRERQHANVTAPLGVLPQLALGILQRAWKRPIAS